MIIAIYLIVGAVVTTLLCEHTGGEAKFYQWLTIVLVWPVVAVPYFTLVLIDYIVGPPD